MSEELNKEHYNGGILWSGEKPCDVCGREPYNDGITNLQTTLIAHHVICMSCLFRGVGWMKSIGKYFIVDIPNQEKKAKKLFLDYQQYHAGKGEEE